MATMIKISHQSLIGQQSVNLVERIVLEMRYAWRATLGTDGRLRYGIL